MNQGDQSDLDISDDEGSELAQYEAWKQRELKRIARDRCAHHILVIICCLQRKLSLALFAVPSKVD